MAGSIFCAGQALINRRAGLTPGYVAGVGYRGDPRRHGTRGAIDAKSLSYLTVSS